MLTMDTEAAAHVPTRRAVLASWLFELVLVAALVAVLLDFDEIREFAGLLRGLRIEWLLAAATLQALTYVCSASVWRLALAHEGCVCSIGMLVRLSFVMLFANQAIPTAGVSGAAVLIRGLRRREVPANVVVAALFVGLVTGYAVYVVAVVGSILVLRMSQGVSLALLLGGGAFALVALIAPAAVIWSRDLSRPSVQKVLRRVPAISNLLDAVATAPVGMLRDPLLLRRLAMFQVGEILLDVATLVVILAATGVHAPVTAVFGSFIMASAVSEAVPIPSGFGTFEAALVGMLRLVGVATEPGLAAALLFRGFSLWVPMLPGLWFARRELSAHARRPAR